MHNNTAPSSCATVTWLVCSTTLGAIIPRWSIFDLIKLKLTESIIKKVAVNKHRMWIQVYRESDLNQSISFGVLSLSLLFASIIRRDTNGLNDQINQSYVSIFLSLSLIHLQNECGERILNVGSRKTWNEIHIRISDKWWIKKNERRNLCAVIF